MSSSPVLAYIVEDNPEQRILLHDIVEPAGFRARAFVSGEEFLAVYNRLSPGIILLDLRLPGMGGAYLVEELARRGCLWPVIVLTAHPSADEASRARQAGAVHVLRKPIKGSVILDTLGDVRSKLMASRVDTPNADVEARFAMLTPGERSVLDGMRDGLVMKQIAANCAVSERTVRARVEHMLKKTGAKSRDHLLQLTRTAGIPVKPPT